MPSTFTTNTGIEKPGDGEQAGLWGDTVNLSSDIIDRALNGVTSIALASTSYTITTSGGTLSDGQYSTVTFTGTPGGTATVTVSPSTAQKTYFIRNSTDQSVVITQGSGGNVTIAAGRSAVVACTGAGASSAVFDITAVMNTATSANTANAVVQRDGSGGFSAGAIAATAGTVDGAAITTASNTQTLTNKTLTSPDINGGTIDGAVIGGTTPAAISGTTGTFSGNLTVDTNTLFVDAANNRVGIGTATPSEQLSVVGSASIGGTAANQPLTLTSTDPLSLIGFEDDTTASVVNIGALGDDAVFRTGGAERMRVLGTGNVGIGTTTPSEKLEVVGRILVDSGAAASIPAVFTSSATNTTISFEDSVTAENAVRIGSNSGDFWVITGGAERMRVLGTGNVGIGTTTPSEKLDVNGTVKATGLNLSGTAVTATAAEINKLDGVTATTAELNILDGVTATTAEINKLDGFTGVVADLNYAKDLRATGVTTAEFDKLDGLTATTAELNFVDGVTSNIQTQLDGKASTFSHATSVWEAGSNTTATLVSPLNVKREIVAILPILDVGGIGTYALLSYASATPPTLSAGATTSGANLRYAAAVTANYTGTSGPQMTASGTPSGTWRLMGRLEAAGGVQENNASLYLRIA